MTHLDALAAQYWLDNTQQFYDYDEHLSGLVIDCYKAGFKAAQAMAVEILVDSENYTYGVDTMGDKEV